MTLYKIQIIETLLIVVLYIIWFFITKTGINNFLKNAQLQRTRRKIIIKALHLISSLVTLLILSAVWGLKQNQIAVFASSIIAAIGIAFFAQWSLLSNITSSILLFFNHPVKLGDYIKMIDKDTPIEGEVTELTYFFVHLKTKNNEIITIPNSLMIVRPFSILYSQEMKP